MAVIGLDTPLPSVSSLLERGDRRRAPAEPARPRRWQPDCPDGGRLTLAGKLAGVWEGLHAVGEAECPVCRASMTLVAGEGRCGGCGARLS